MLSIILPLVLLSAAFIINGEAFSINGARSTAEERTGPVVASRAEDDAAGTRRAFLVDAGLSGAIIFLPGAANAEAETMERGGVQLTPFNSLAFNYRGGDNPTVDTAKLDEESISYAEFLEKLEAGRVKFVEFLAPNGDAAYATIVSEDGNENKPIRIGEGYPIEDPGGWSSPAFVVKAVAKKGVPYKFVVPGLGDSFLNM